VTVARSPEYRHATSRVLRWAAWYTRGLDREIAEERLDELASDLHDHAVWADEAGLSVDEATRAITRRGLRGVLDDLSWRRAQLRRMASSDPLAMRARRQSSAVLASVLLVGLVVVAGGGFALTRTLQYLLRMHDDAVIATVVLLTASLVLAVVGLALLMSPRLRFLGAAVLMIAVVGVVQYAFTGLIYGSAAVNNLLYFAEWWPFAKNGLIVALAAFFAAAVLWWWPAKRGERMPVRSDEGAR